MQTQIIIHLTTAIVALVLAIVLLTKTKGTKHHKLLGQLFVASLGTSVLSTFWILSNGAFSYIHLLSVFTLYWLVFGVLNARTKTKDDWRINHAKYMLSACIAIVSAGSGVVARHLIIPGSTSAGLVVTLVTVVICIPITRRYLKRLTRATF